MVAMDELLSGGAEMLDDLGRSQGSVRNSNLVDLALEGGLLVVSAAEKDGGEPGSLARRDIAGDLGSIVSIKMNDDVLAVAGENDVVPGGTDREISASFEQEKSATEVGQPTPVG